MLEAVIFDWDGTLADSKQVIANAFQHVLKEYGCEIDAGYLDKRIGIGPRNILQDVFKVKQIPFNEIIIDKLVKTKIKVNEEWTGNINLFEGARDLLDLLKEHMKMGLATMNNKSVIEKILLEKRVRKYFDSIITFDDVEKPKPDPEIFLKCAMKLKCQPQSCLVIEDSIYGVIAAKKAKMKCIAILSNTYTKEELEKEKPDLIIKSISKKRQIMQFILNADSED